MREPSTSGSEPLSRSLESSDPTIYPLLGVLDGTEMPVKQIVDQCKCFTTVYAADGSANQLVDAGFVPSVVVGDLDSVREDVLAVVPEVVRVSDQETTDCDKLLALAEERRFKSVLLTNVEGDRPDHFLATLSSAARSHLEIGFRFRKGWGSVVRPDQARIAPGFTGMNISLIPITACRGVRLTGVRWPLDYVDLAPGGALSVSNRASGGELVSASLDEGVAVLIWTKWDAQGPSK